MTFCGSDGWIFPHVGKWKGCITHSSLVSYFYLLHIMSHWYLTVAQQTVWVFNPLFVLGACDVLSGSIKLMVSACVGQFSWHSQWCHFLSVVGMLFTWPAWALLLLLSYLLHIHLCCDSHWISLWPMSALTCDSAPVHWQECQGVVIRFLTAMVKFLNQSLLIAGVAFPDVSEDSSVLLICTACLARNPQHSGCHSV